MVDVNNRLVFVITLTIDALILFFVDSVHCDKDYFAISYALFMQLCIYLLYTESSLIKDIEFIMKWRNIPVLFIVFIGSLGILANGSVGMDTAGRTMACPNTGLSYLFQ